MFFRNVYAENCFYVVVQDHGLGYLQIIKGMFISNVIAINSDFAVLSQVHGVRHGDVSITSVIAKECRQTLRLKDLDWVRVVEVRVIGSRGSGPIVNIYNCADLKLRDISIIGGKPVISDLSSVSQKRQHRGDHPRETLKSAVWDLCGTETEKRCRKSQNITSRPRGCSKTAHSSAKDKHDPLRHWYSIVHHETIAPTDV
ncbi:hypothetical protein NDN08_004536 [Rhodosorus marinus]|uniref:Uncharacterized protein n=1 Tax=Rhodosorus marinus TaxID=101924 RepID=A0AAV8UQR2_9RHOD|nr:hypothetical protein NDN08_004536 [Rhodosorus marinus]